MPRAARSHTPRCSKRFCDVQNLQTVAFACKTVRGRPPKIQAGRSWLEPGMRERMRFGFFLLKIIAGGLDDE